MAYHDLDVRKLELIKQRLAKEDEIERIYRVVSDVWLSRQLVSGRDYWVKLYNRRIAEYKAFCIKNTLKMSIFVKVTE